MTWSRPPKARPPKRWAVLLVVIALIAWALAELAEWYAEQKGGKD